MKHELIVALDVPSSDSIPQVVDMLPAEIVYYKVGLELFASEGPRAFKYLKKKNKKIFLDLKLHDIPRTVARAVTAAGRHGVALLTVHATGGYEMLKAAAESAKNLGKFAPKLVAVTTLTSLSGDDLKEMGVSQPLKEHTLVLGKMAISAGIDGVVCSVHEAAAFRSTLGKDPILITPGIRLRPSLSIATVGQIRPAGADAGDQKRIATPEMAVRAGSNFLVVGRPILQADNPAAVAREILKEMKEATDHRIIENCKPRREKRRWNDGNDT